MQIPFKAFFQNNHSILSIHCIILLSHKTQVCMSCKNEDIFEGHMFHGTIARIVACKICK